MGYSNGKISGSVSHSDINAVLGTNYKTNRELCTAAAINKWAKCKPIRHTSNGPLTSAQRKGTGEDISSGIMYGLKVSSNVTILSELHNATWDYVRPTGGIGTSPYRLQDFNGYYHSAAPTLKGEGLGETLYMDSSHPFGVILRWNVTNNTDGVDIKEMVSGITDATLEWGDLCLCVLIDGYMTALINSRMSTTNQWAPIYYNGTYCDTFTCPELNSALKTTGNHKITVVATDAQSAAQFQGSWKYVLDDALYSGVYISIPDLAGKTVEFTSGDGSSSKYGEWDGGTASVMSSALRMSFNLVSAPTESCTYKITLEFGGLPANTKTFTMSAGGTFPPIVSWATSELGVLPMSGDVYNVSAMLYGVGTANNTYLTQISTSVTWP